LVWVLGIIATVIGGVAVYYLTQRQQETINAIRETINAFTKFVLYLLQQTWFLVTALAVGCFVVGFLLGWFLRKVDGSRADKRKELGTEMLKLAHHIGDYAVRIDGDPVNAFRPQITSCFAAARKLGMRVPDDRIFSIQRPYAMDLIVDYLTQVGQMLKDGHFLEAKRDARKSEANFNKAYAQYRLT